MLVTVALNAVGKDAGIPEKLCIKSNFSGLHDEIDICAIEARFYHFMVDHMKCPTVQCYYADWEDDGSGQGLIILEDMEKFGGKFGSSLDTNGVDGVAKGLEGLAVLHGSLWGNPRSEEHTSELQSLMRISYAVFCLKKKKQQVTMNQNFYMTNDTSPQ